MAKTRTDAKTIRQLTDGLFSSIVDATLYYLLFLPVAAFGKKGSVMQAFDIVEEADYLKGQLGYKQFKNAYLKLKEKGLIKSIKEWKDKTLATEEGLKRLQSLLPFYDEERRWDGNLYIVQYDIPIHQDAIRNRLRDWLLRKLGAIRLLDSSYILFKNPQELVKRFIKQFGELEGNVIISRLPKDGFLGHEDLGKFLWERSGLAEVNEKYRQFIESYKHYRGEMNSKIFLDYFSILRDDPQIPFELLPDDYLGDGVYLLFLQLSKNTLFGIHVHRQEQLLGIFGD